MKVFIFFHKSTVRRKNSMEDAVEPTDFSISYSFGGSKEAPLVRRRIEMIVTQTVTASNLQEILLERTDKIIEDLCLVFDTASSALLESAYTDGTQVDIMMGACAYCTYNILVQSPSMKYGCMYLRTQTLLNALPNLKETLGEKAVGVVYNFVTPVWETLRMIDSGFAKDLKSSEEGPPTKRPTI